MNALLRSCFATVSLALVLACPSLGQCVALAGTGCPGEVALSCDGPPPPCLPVPSSTCGFSISAAPAFPATRACAGSSVILFGACFLPAVEIPFPLACATGCRLAISPVLGAFPDDPLFVAPNVVPPGSVWCAQAACVAVDDSGEGLCVQLGQAITVVIGP
ncbi:MAG: hypothetical protein KDB80_06485 [Planctomycetes bacterium]|nr:hypothetical protein [Planctomycetota bacterium]